MWKNIFLNSVLSSLIFLAIMFLLFSPHLILCVCFGLKYICLFAVPFLMCQVVLYPSCPCSIPADPGSIVNLLVPARSSQCTPLRPCQILTVPYTRLFLPAFPVFFPPAGFFCLFLHILWTLPLILDHLEWVACCDKMKSFELHLFSLCRLHLGPNACGQAQVEQ